MLRVVIVDGSGVGGGGVLTAGGVREEEGGVDASRILEFGDACVCVNSRRRVTRPSGAPRLRVVALGV